MFVFEGRQTGAEFRDQHEIDSVIAGLEREGYKATLRSMLRAAADAISITHTGLPVALLTDRRRVLPKPHGKTLIVGDLIFKDDHAYLIQPVGHRIHIWEIRHHSVDSMLSDFCSIFESSTRKSLDGRRVRGMDFNWRGIKEQISRQVVASSRFYKETKLDTKTPDYLTDEAAAARIFILSSVRPFLLRLAQVSKARASDATSDAEALPIDDLLKHGLIRREYLILCRKDSHTICTIQDPAELSTPPASAFTCPVCGRTLKDEVIQEIFALSDIGRNLVTSSRWMLIWVTELLIASGIAREQIAWSPTASGEEIDIMTDALGPRVFFELKDREFGLGDAYPFTYRVSRYGGGFGVVITTEKVADEAKRFFEEQSSNMGGEIMSLEGPQNIEGGILQLTDRFSRIGVLQLLLELAAPIALDTRPILRAWMDKTANRATASKVTL